MDTNVQNIPPLPRPSGVNRRQVVALVASVVNILISLIPLLIIAQYLGLVPFRGRPVEEGQQIWVIIMLSYGVVVFAYSVYCLIRYFRHKKISLTLPLVFLGVYVCFIMLVLAVFALFQGMLNGDIIL